MLRGNTRKKHRKPNAAEIRKADDLFMWRLIDQLSSHLRPLAIFILAGWRNEFHFPAFIVSGHRPAMFLSFALFCVIKMLAQLSCWKIFLAGNILSFPEYVNRA